MTAKWKSNAKHLRVALERLVHNFATQAECSHDEAIVLAVGILNQMRNKGKKNPYSLGPLDTTQTHGGIHRKEEEEE